MKLLANNPDWTYERIGEEMGMTSRSVGYRIERLRELNVLQKANLIYYDRLGDLIYAAILKFDTGLSSKKQKEMIDKMKSYDATIQVFSAIGAFGAILLFHAEDPKEAETIVRELIISQKCFASYQISQITDIFSIYRHYI